MGGPGTWGEVEITAWTAEEMGKIPIPGLQANKSQRQVGVALDAVVGEKSMQGWTQMWKSSYKRRAEAARNEEFI